MNEGDVPVDAMHSAHVAGVLQVRCDGGAAQIWYGHVPVKCAGW
ncbi:MAG: hypothetical protein E6474_08680 [Actinomyces sp.]|nr:hypothetical protein [Actinomyces sp.]